MRIIREHDGRAAKEYWHMDCGTEASWYELEDVASPYAYYVYRLQNRVLGNLGVRPWWVHARVAVEGSQVVCWIYEVTALRSDGLHLDAHVNSFAPSPPTEKLGEQRPAYFGESPQPSYSEMGMFYSGVGPGGDGLGLKITHRATPEERRRAFDINFGCLTQLRQCQAACELMPSVYRERVRRGKEDSESIRVCQRVLAAGETSQAH